MATYDAIIVGGGLVGAATAYYLTRGGARTLLVDRGDPGRATDAGAGIISPETSAYPDAWFDFAVQAAADYPHLVAELQAAGASVQTYARSGLIACAVSDDEIEPYLFARDLMFARHARRGASSDGDLYELDSDAAHERFPPLAPVQHAIYSRAAARIDGRELRGALLTAAKHQGLEIRHAGAEALTLANGACTGIVSDAVAIDADAVVIAGGAWSGAFGEQLGIPVAVEPQRGQIVHLDLPDTDTTGWPLIGAFRGHYLVPWPGGRIAVGATRETGSGFAPATTAAGIREVLDEALRVAPGLAAGRVVDIRVGLRPLTSDGLPVIGPVPGVPGVWLATGHGPTGLTLGPYTGKVVAAAIAGGPADPALVPFSVARFG